MSTAASQTRPTQTPSLRDKSMDYSVRYLFGNRFEVRRKSDGRRYYVECVYFGGEFIARCGCPDKKFNLAPTCKHEEATLRHERFRVPRPASVSCNPFGREV